MYVHLAACTFYMHFNLYLAHYRCRCIVICIQLVVHCYNVLIIIFAAVGMHVCADGGANSLYDSLEQYPECREWCVVTDNDFLLELIVQSVV